MKKTILYFLLAVNITGIQAQEQIFTVGRAISEALGNRENIAGARTEYLIAKSQTSSAKKALIPQLSLAYNYRYNFVSPSQIVPVGLFFPVPTDEKRAIRFGTAWQQSAGATLYLPLFDLVLPGRIKESRINERLSNLSVKAAEEELAAEVIKTYLNIYTGELSLQSAAEDTARNSNIRNHVYRKFTEGRAMKSEVNIADISLRKSLDAYHTAYSELIKEKMYISFLTGLDFEKVINFVFDFSFIERSEILNLYLSNNFDSVNNLLRLRFSGDIVSKQILTEKGKMLPVAGIEAFAGGNQFTDSFDPLNAGKWYGSSYAGLSVRIPLAGGEVSGNRIRELRLREKSIAMNYNDELKRTINRSLILNEEIRQLKGRMEAEEEVLNLRRENLAMYRERFETGLISPSEMLNYDLEFQYEKLQYRELIAELLAKKIDAVRNSGNMEKLIRELKQN